MKQVQGKDQEGAWDWWEGLTVSKASETRLQRGESDRHWNGGDLEGPKIL